MLEDNHWSAGEIEFSSHVLTAVEALVDKPEERVMLAGTANLARSTALDFPGTLRPVLEALTARDSGSLVRESLAIVATVIVLRLVWMFGVTALPGGRHASLRGRLGDSYQVPVDEDAAIGISKRSDRATRVGPVSPPMKIS